MGFAKPYITVVGVVLVISGLLAFVSNPFVGSSSNAILAADALHNFVHIATGLLGLWLGFTKRGESLARGVVGFGYLYVVLFIVLVATPTLFGLLSIPVNGADHVLHAALGFVSLLVGYSARRGAVPAAA
jgi:hypothetical protein